MAKVFISYSHNDIEFAKRLTAELQKSNLDFWIDWEGIPPTVDWWKEIEKGIEEADVFIFLISPDSASSKVCGQEIETAIKNGKRIIPIVVREIELLDSLPQLRHINYIFFTRGDDFDTAARKLITAIQTDYQWAATHRRLQVKALEWERSNKEKSFLLRGSDLQSAESQLAINSAKTPSPTTLQIQYVIESREAEDLQQRSSRSRRNVVAFVGSILLITIGLALTGKLNSILYQPRDMDDYWVTIPDGEFQMGSENGIADESPIHTVYLDEYQIGKYEITNRQFAQCVRADVCVEDDPPADGQDQYPVVSVAWSDAVTFCNWVGARLPTEAEWEKAARGGLVGKTFPWGDEAAQCKTGTLTGANFGGAFDGAGCPHKSMPVGSYAANGYGIYDTMGNVAEWVNDWYSDTYYLNSPLSNPTGPEEGISRVTRGGSWFYGQPQDTPTALAPPGSEVSELEPPGVGALSVSYRGNDYPIFVVESIGFRCVRDRYSGSLKASPSTESSQDLTGPPLPPGLPPVP